MRHTNALNDFKPNTKLIFRGDWDTLQQLIRSLEYAQCRQLSDKEINQLLNMKFTDDPRRGYPAVFASAPCHYTEFYDRIHRCLELFDELVITDKQVKIAAVVAKSTTPSDELCREFAKSGACSRGTNCRYVHKPLTLTKSPPPPPADRKNKKDWSKADAPPLTTGRPVYTVVSKNHRVAVGSSRGVISVLNPEGYDDRQIVHINTLQ